MAQPIKGALVHRGGVKKPDGSLMTWGDLYGEVTTHNVMKGGMIYSELFADPAQATNFLNKISGEGSLLGRAGVALNPAGRKSLGARFSRWEMIPTITAITAHNRGSVARIFTVGNDCHDRSHNPLECGTRFPWWERSQP